MRVFVFIAEESSCRVASSGSGMIEQSTPAPGRSYSMKGTPPFTPLPSSSLLSSEEKLRTFHVFLARGCRYHTATPAKTQIALSQLLWLNIAIRAKRRVCAHAFVVSLV